MEVIPCFSLNNPENNIEKIFEKNDSNKGTDSDQNKNSNKQSNKTDINNRINTNYDNITKPGFQTKKIPYSALNPADMEKSQQMKKGIVTYEKLT